MNNIIVDLVKVAKVYEMSSQRVTALQNINFQVSSGKAVAVTGKSGAGKSSLLHIIGTLDRPDSGRVLLHGADVVKMSDSEVSEFRNSKIGFVFQMNNLLPEFTALENVMMPGLIARASKNAVRERAQKLLTEVGLKERVNHRPSELSGGEQQRVAIARSLLMAPPILLADEPTGNLDRKTSHAIQDLLLELVTVSGVTLILVTHDLELAKRLPNQAVMDDGRIVDGSQFL